MTRTPGIVFALVTLTAAVPSAKAGGTANIKCAPNEDRVWGYESLPNLRVAAKRKCGEPVQIVERVKGYVKIETANGTEGYVLDTSFPKSVLPPAPAEKPNDVESAAAAFAARRGSRAPDNSIDSPASAHASAPTLVASTAPPAAPLTVVKPAALSQPQPQTTVTLSSAAPAPAAVAAEPPPMHPTPTATAKNSNSAPSTSNAVVAENIAPAAPAKSAYTPA